MFGEKLIDYVAQYENVVPPTICKQIIDLYESNQQYVKEYDTDVYKFHQLDMNRTSELLRVAEYYSHALLPCYEDYFAKLNLRQYVELNTWESVRIKKYIKGTTDEFKTHVDVTDHDSAARFAIAILYLNDNNGLTTFPNLGIGVQPKAGKVVIFPPTWMFPHSGLTPTNADKYIMMTCLHYK